MILPNFIICGAQRAGTTSLFHYLKAHPQVYMAPTKEVHFFDLNYEKGIDWYEKHFRSSNPEKHKAIGEVSPFYMYLHEVPERIYRHLPDRSWYIYKIIPPVIYGIKAMAFYYLTGSLQLNREARYLSTLTFVFYPVSLKISWDLHRNSLGVIFLIGLLAEIIRDRDPCPLKQRDAPKSRLPPRIHLSSRLVRQC